MALISGGSTIIGGLMGRSSAKAQNKQAQNNAQIEMDFQERMSSTAHQREVADLRAAGLNPILSAHGGASSPGGAMAPVVNTEEPLRDSIKSASASALDSANIMLTRETAKTQRSQQELNRANAAKSLSEASGFMGIPGMARVPINRLRQFRDHNPVASSARWLGKNTAHINFPRLKRKG